MLGCKPQISVKEAQSTTSLLRRRSLAVRDQLCRGIDPSRGRSTARKKEAFSLQTFLRARVKQVPYATRKSVRLTTNTSFSLLAVIYRRFRCHVLHLCSFPSGITTSVSKLVDPIQILVQERRSFSLGQDGPELGMPTCLEYAQDRERRGYEGPWGDKRESWGREDPGCHTETD